MGVSLVVTGVMTMFAPLCKSLASILVTLGPPEFFGAALGMGRNIESYLFLIFLIVSYIVSFL